jgi:8-amino-7-oxononanoate synthase
VKAAGVYPYFQEIEENHGPVVKLNGREIIMAGSNNYLGLSKHPEVIEASRKAVHEFGTSCSGSRYLNGTLILHTALEEELADYLGMESCLLFTTGFLTNQGVLPTVVHRNECLITDKDNHASIVAGALIAKALGAQICRYKTNDMESLQKTLEGLPPDAPKLIVTDGVFSMSGYIVNLPELTLLAKKYRARVMIDDAHSIGVLGEHGQGTCSHFGLKNREDLDLVMGTFSKSFASLGGFIAGERKITEYIKHHSQALIFSASMTPANVAAVHAALKIVKREPERINRIREISAYVRNGFKQVGLKILEGITPIVPVITGDDMKTFQIWRRLIDEGVFANAVISPAVPPGQQLIRTSFIATHENEHLDKTIEVFQKVGKEFGLLE